MRGNREPRKTNKGPPQVDGPRAVVRGALRQVIRERQQWARARGGRVPAVELESLTNERHPCACNREGCRFTINRRAGQAMMTSSIALQYR